HCCCLSNCGGLPVLVHIYTTRVMAPAIITPKAKIRPLGTTPAVQNLNPTMPIKRDRRFGLRLLLY
ncbi:MAG: hypothetical protein NZ703_05715, partial [Gemmataceae bacterium]|nr:hypothetical protein [Gemmataceae bacterium]